MMPWYWVVLLVWVTFCLGVVYRALWVAGRP
jgi:hypothetical protein